MPPRSRVEDLPDRPQPKVIRRLTDENFDDIANDFIRAIMAGCSKDEAASVALINESDMLSLISKKIVDYPDWLNDAETVGRSRMKGLARVKVMEKVENGDSSFVLPVAQATSPDLSPKQVSVKVDFTSVLPDDERDRLLGKFPSAKIMDVNVKSHGDDTDEGGA